MNIDLLSSPRLSSNLLRFSLVMSLFFIQYGCEESSSDSSTSPPSTPSEPTLPETEDIPLDGDWVNYTVTPPTVEQNQHLVSTPYRYPTQSCRLASEFESLPPETTLTLKEDQQEYVCVWNSPTAAAPEGVYFNEIGACDHVFTQAPSWFVEPKREYASDRTLLEDETFITELHWARDQISSSGCGCCHSSNIGSEHASGWDAGAPEVWTDTLSNARLYLLSGMIEEHQSFGEFNPDENHGFTRSEVMQPSSDPERLRAFFLSEFERRGGSEEDKMEAQQQMDSLFSRKEEESRECIQPFEGLIDGKFVWNDEQTSRQVYIQEIESELPGFPPNLDRPAGTVWAFRMPADQAEGFPSGTIELGVLPEKAIQLVPQDGSAPQFESGKTYRFFVTPDVMLLRLANCVFTAP